MTAASRSGRLCLLREAFTLPGAGPSRQLLGGAGAGTDRRPCYPSTAPPSRCPHLLSLVVELVRGSKAEAGGNHHRGLVLRMDVSSQRDHTLVPEPITHGQRRLAREAAPLPSQPHDPGQFSRLTHHGRLDEPDRNSSETENPVVPAFFWTGRSSHLVAVLLLETIQGGGLSTGECIQIRVGEHTDHFARVRNFERRQDQTRRLKGVGREHRSTIAPKSRGWAADAEERGVFVPWPVNPRRLR